MTKETPSAEYTDYSYCRRGCFVYYEFYIDQFFVEHLLIGYLLLRLTAKLGHMQVSWKRILGGSLLNTVLMLLAVCAGNFWWYVPGFLFAGLWIFRGKSGKKAVRQTMLLLWVTVCFGGAMEVLLSLWRIPVFLGGIAAAGYLEWAQHRQEQYSLNLSRLAEAELFFCGKQISLTALIDTGNQLKEPLTGKAVSIVEERAVCSLLGENWEKHRGFYLIPYHSLGKEKGWLRGVTIDRMTIRQEGRTEQFSGPILALYGGKLSAQKQYQIILHPQHAVPGKIEGGT